MENQEFPSSCLLVSTFFKPPKFDFNSFYLNVPEKRISIYVSHGNCLIDKSGNTADPPKYDKTYKYPSENENIPERLKNYSEELLQIAEEVNDCLIDDIQLEWGLNDENDKNENPYLLSIKNGTFKPKNELQERYLFDYLLFFCYEIAKPVEESICFLHTKNCVGGYQTIERKKIEAHNCAHYIQKLQLDNKKEMYDYIMKRFSTLCPEMMFSPTPICPNCFAKYSQMVEITNKKQNETQNQKQPKKERERSKGSFTQRDTKRSISRPSTSLTSRTAPQPSSRRGVTSKSTTLRSTTQTFKPIHINHSAEAMADLDKYYSTTRKSINGRLRPTQSISLQTYKQAYRIYHNQMGFVPVLRINKF